MEFEETTQNYSITKDFDAIFWNIIRSITYNYQKTNCLFIDPRDINYEDVIIQPNINKLNAANRLQQVFIDQTIDLSNVIGSCTINTSNDDYLNGRIKEVMFSDIKFNSTFSINDGLWFTIPYSKSTITIKNVKVVQNPIKGADQLIAFSVKHSDNLVEITTTGQQPINIFLASCIEHSTKDNHTAIERLIIPYIDSILFEEKKEGSHEVMMELFNTKLKKFIKHYKLE